jgi:glycine betaine/proline transport system ATP-binding protein
MQSVLLDLQKELKKTVVFITHDLDEALRLGDKIAILRDGKVVQQGSGQDIVLKPADDYISAFVKEVNRGRVIKVSTVMKPIVGEGSALRIPADMTLETAARQMTGANQTVAMVVDDSGKPVGSLDLHSIILSMVTPTSHETTESKVAA